MTSKQLTNVLIKMLGLSLCVHAIPSLVNAFLTPLIQSGIGSHSFYWAGSVVSFGIGIYLIVKSRTVAEWLFKGEEE